MLLGYPLTCNGVDSLARHPTGIHFIVGSYWEVGNHPGQCFGDPPIDIGFLMEHNGSRAAVGRDASTELAIQSPHNWNDDRGGFFQTTAESTT